MNLETIIDEVRQKLDRRDQARERIFELSRTAIRLSANTIKSVHRKQLDVAEENISRTRDTLKDIVDSVEHVPELLHSGIVNSAFQEYSEASLFLALIRDGTYPSPDEISVPFYDAYLLGLGDLVGELRRSALDAICEDKIESAAAMLGRMDEILSILVTLDYPDAIIPGLRHKCDVARNLVEKTRGDIANAVSNQNLIREMKKLNERLQ